MNLLTEIAIVWTNEDIQDRAKEIGVKLTPREISDVLSALDRKHDATIGINWDVIDYWIDTIVDER